MSIGVGKMRGLQELSAESGTMTVLALDQRSSLMKALNIDKNDPDVYQIIKDFKMELVAELLPGCSAVLLDPQFSAAEAICTGRISGQKGLIVATEKSGYIDQDGGRLDQVLPDWSLKKAKRMGASASKLLVYYNPELQSFARKQEKFVSGLVKEAADLDIPLLLEPMSYSSNPELSKNSPEFAARRPKIVQKTAETLGSLGVDLLKMEFPCDFRFEQDKKAWMEECIKLTESAPVPWVLLSAGVDYEVFREQLEIACKAGASGFVAGRAIWKEAAEHKGKERTSFLKNTARNRISELVGLVDKYASSWKDGIEPNTWQSGSDWYKNYPEF